MECDAGWVRESTGPMGSHAGVEPPAWRSDLPIYLCFPVQREHQRSFGMILCSLRHIKCLVLGHIASLKERQTLNLGSFSSATPLFLCTEIPSPSPEADKFCNSCPNSTWKMRGGGRKFSVRYGAMRETSQTICEPFDVHMCTLSQGWGSCLSLTNRPRVDKQKTAFFTRQEEPRSSFRGHVFLLLVVCLLTTLFKGATRNERESRKGYLRCN